MTTFQKAKLGDIYKFQYGKGNTNPSNGGKYPVYGAGSILGYFDEYNTENSPVIGHMGANCGTVIFGKGKHFVTYNGIMALIKEGNDSRFGYYTLLSKDFRKSIRGSAQPFISYDLLNNVDILLPNPPIQTCIGSILSTYDDLIENNEKRIKALEEMAQLLYTEWFVKPEKTSEMTELGTKIDIKKGKNITLNTITHGNVPVVAGGLSPAYYHNKANTLAPVITISASGANAGFINLYYKNIWASDCSFIDRNTTPYPYFYYLFLKNNQTKITKSQRGSAQPHVYPADLMRLKISNIPEDLLKKFENKIEIIFNDIRNIKKQNDNLSQTRDLLIPQLVTGKRELK